MDSGNLNDIKPASEGHMTISVNGFHRTTGILGRISGSLPGRAVMAACLLTAFLRCGIYSFTGATLPPHLKTVAVPLFDNRSPEFGVDQKITDAVIDAVTQDNTLKIADPSNADCILRGTLMRMDERAGQYDSNEEASTYRITLTVQASFEDLRKKTVIWQNSFSAFGTYSTNRDDAIAEAVEKLTTDIINKMVSNW
jgi:outer membrane lipopolysaccharide assembly protein LptE/RlpB